MRTIANYEDNTPSSIQEVSFPDSRIHPKNARKRMRNEYAK
ncbi:hypothetical protein D019_4687 [Vibrio parahaemolyticus VP2007-095]|nr:hypothetical protein D019_4687 [Vibrio parahaemolyticus VP2007-095]